MARQLMVKDSVYQRLKRLKGENRSFSDVIELLLDASGYDQVDLLQVLQSQNELLKQILREIRMLNSRLSSLRLEVKEAREIRSVTAVTSKENKKLPSFIHGNPWVEILQKRCEEV